MTRRWFPPERSSTPDNLAPLVHARRYCFDMLDGETIWGLLLDVALDGTASIELAGGEVIHRACGQIRRLTLSDADPGVGLA